tara:strand:- start:411 stop:2531 length:2121 start_codon:yes stop_codon:yes gene_type:complete
MEKDKVNELDNKTKDGIHILFCIKMTKQCRKLLRQMVMKDIQELLSDMPLTNRIEEVIDEGIANSSVNCQMYGSRKPGHQAYKLTYKYIVKNSDEIIPHKVTAISKEDLLEMSVQYDGHPQYEIKEKVIHILKETNDKPKIFTPPSTPAPCDNITEEQIEILDNIDYKYWSEYSTWRDLVWAIKNTFGDSSFEIAKQYSQKTNADNYDEDALLKKLEECNDTRISWGTISFYSKQSNLKKYEKIITKYKKIQDQELKKAGKELLIKAIEEKKEEEKKQTEDDFEKMKIDFEKTHCKIVNKTIYISETEDGVIMFKECNLIISYRHLKYKKPKYNQKGEFIGMIETSFINDWIGSTEIRRYKDVGVYPPPLKCPDDIFNLWQPFGISKLTDEYEKDQEGLDIFLNHIKILCGNDENVADYIIKWFAQMFQYPAIKTIMPTFISSEGAGKGTVMELMARMMGSKKTLVTTTPSETVWGSFNTLMSQCFFVNLNELSKKETLHSEGKIKGLITDSQLTINDKGISAYIIYSCHRFIATTQSEDPVKTKKDDRRNIIIRSSDELCNNKEYFINIREKLEKINVMRTIYDYFMSIEGLDKFVSIPIPKTEYQNDMKEVSRSPFCRWIESYIIERQNDTEDPKLLGEEQYKLFKIWSASNGIIHETSSVKMALALKRLNIDGVQTGIKGMTGNYTKYNIEKLKKHYMIGCQI